MQLVRLITNSVIKLKSEKKSIHRLQNQLPHRSFISSNYSIHLFNITGLNNLLFLRRFDLVPLSVVLPFGGSRAFQIFVFK